MTFRLFGIMKESITDGPGIRYAIFAQGCPHFCFGCHNPESHDFRGGFEQELSELEKEIKSNPLLDGVTFSGGEPFMQAEEFAELAKRVRSETINIICYSGYTFEEILEQSPERSGWKDLLENIDILIDGRFELNQRSLNLRFRGSMNQRAIDVPASLKQEQVVLYQL